MFLASLGKKKPRKQASLGTVIPVVRAGQGSVASVLFVTNWTVLVSCLWLLLLFVLAVKILPARREDETRKCL
jgi:hypothetical protein